MPLASTLPIAAAAAGPFQVGRPLFGHAGLALLAVLLGVAVLLGLVALLGRWLAATHPAPPPRAAKTVVAEIAGPLARSAPRLGPDVAPEVVPVVLAVVAQMFGGRARVADIRRVSAPPAAVPSVEALMQQWSYEGRRQIYSSHKVR